MGMGFDTSDDMWETPNKEVVDTEPSIEPEISKFNKILFETKRFKAILIQHFKQLDTNKLTNIIKESIMELIPVRSGRLLDTILNTMKIELTHSDLNNLYFDLTYTHADARTDPVGPGRVKHGIVVSGQQEFGMGEDYIPTNPIPNVRRVAAGSQVQNTSNYGNPLNVVLYELDDPTAREEIIETMTNIYIAAFIPEFEKVLKAVKLPGNIQISGISGEITQSENMERFLKGGLS